SAIGLGSGEEASRVAFSLPLFGSLLDIRGSMRPREPNTWLGAASRAQQSARGASKRRRAAAAVAITFGVLVLLGGAKGVAQDNTAKDNAAQDNAAQDKAAKGNAAKDNAMRELQTEATPIDAFGYLGGLIEARFYEPHATTGDP